MSTVYGQVETECPITIVYAYLKGRYQGDTFRSVSMMTRGYVPEVHRLEEQENERLSFRVAGRDSLLHFKTRSWRWTYELTPLHDGRTKVAITYEWDLLFSLLTMFTARGQAANELTETALAIDALTASKRLQPDRESADAAPDR